MLEIIWRDAISTKNLTEVPKSSSIHVGPRHHILVWQINSVRFFLRSCQIAGHFHDIAGHGTSGLNAGLFHQKRVNGRSAFLINAHVYIIIMYVGVSRASITDHILDPLVRLSLGVDEEGPSSGILNDDAVLYAQVVARKTGDLPAPNSDGVAERVN